MNHVNLQNEENKMYKNTEVVNHKSNLRNMHS